MGVMSGWKTWAGAIIIGGAAVAKALGYQEVAEALTLIGGAFGIVGIGHKIEKSSDY